MNIEECTLGSQLDSFAYGPTLRTGIVRKEMSFITTFLERINQYLDSADESVDGMALADSYGYTYVSASQTQVDQYETHLNLKFKLRRIECMFTYTTGVQPAWSIPPNFVIETANCELAYNTFIRRHLKERIKQHPMWTLKRQSDEQNIPPPTGPRFTDTELQEI
jgi:hypothetical protein